ncbi:unnamed protein product [Penicillium pancosmium]
MVRPTPAKGKKPQRNPEPEPEVLSDAAVSHGQPDDESEDDELPVSPTPKPRTPRLLKPPRRSFVFTYPVLSEMSPEEQDGFIEFERPYKLQEYLQDNPKRYERLFDIQNDMADKLKLQPVTCVNFVRLNENETNSNESEITSSENETSSIESETPSDENETNSHENSALIEIPLAQRHQK